MYARDVESALELAAKNPYWREADATMVLSFWRDSGQTLSAFVRQFGLSVGRLRRWHRRLADQELPTFHPIYVASEAPSVAPSVAPTHGDDAGVDLIVAGGRRVTVRPGFDADTLARVVHVLEAMSC